MPYGSPFNRSDRPALQKDSTAYREPPGGWEEAALWLVENTIAHHEKLARKLRNAVAQSR